MTKFILSKIGSYFAIIFIGLIIILHLLRSQLDWGFEILVFLGLPWNLSLSLAININTTNWIFSINTNWIFFIFYLSLILNTLLLYFIGVGLENLKKTRATLAKILISIIFIIFILFLFFILFLAFWR